MIFGSGIVLKLMERFPIIITLGAMLLGWIAGEMLAKEEIIEPYLHGSAVAHYALSAGGALVVLAIGKFMSRGGDEREAAPAKKDETAKAGS